MTDFTITNHGSLLLLRPTTDEAKEWVEEHLTHPETQFFGGAVAVEPRYIQPIIDGIEDDGLTVQ